MSDVLVRFEREDLDGLVAVGSVLLDVQKRLGIRATGACNPHSGDHFCSVLILSDDNLLSPMSAAETEHFAAVGRKQGERLGCETRIIEVGEITIMTEEKNKTNTDKPKRDKFVEEFEALPLDQKLSSLFRIEAVALSETLEYVVNSPMQALSKVGDAMSEFGSKIEAEFRQAAKSAKASTPKEDAEPKRAASPRAKRPAANPKKAPPKKS